MAAILFKRRYLPNIDGSDSATALTDGNTAFVHTYQGDDLTGDGTRAKPYKTINKAGQKSGISYILFRGVPNEYFSYPSLIMIGDDINQTFITANFTPNFRSIYTATVDKINGSYSGWYYTMYAVIINGDWLATTAYITSSKVLMKGLRINSANGSEIN